MLEVHHLNNSRSQRVLWLLEELEVPYTVVRYQRDPKTMLAPPELARVHPLGKSPVIRDEHGVVAETGAIVEYLVETYGNGRLEPARGTPEYRLYRYWMHYAEGSLMPPLLLKLVIARLGPLGWPARKVVDGFVTNQLRWLEHNLQERPWFCGTEFTAADIMLSFPLEAARSRGLDARFPKLLEVVQRMHARPAWQRALAQGGAYAYAD